MTHTNAHTVTLAEAMARRRLTQEQLEAASGVNQTSISKLLSSKYRDPKLSTYHKLVAGLHALGALRRNEVLVLGREVNA